MLFFFKNSFPDSRTNFRDYVHSLDRLEIYVDRTGGQTIGQATAATTCGSITRLNDALFRSTIHVQCQQAMRGRFVYVEAYGVNNRWTRMFNAVLCEVMVYE